MVAVALFQATKQCSRVSAGFHPGAAIPCLATRYVLACYFSKAGPKSQPRSHLSREAAVHTVGGSAVHASDEASLPNQDTLSLTCNRAIATNMSSVPAATRTQHAQRTSDWRLPREHIIIMDGLCHLTLLTSSTPALICCDDDAEFQAVHKPCRSVWECPRRQ